MKEQDQSYERGECKHGFMFSPTGKCERCNEERIRAEERAEIVAEVEKLLAHHMKGTFYGRQMVCREVLELLSAPTQSSDDGEARPANLKRLQELWVEIDFTLDQLRGSGVDGDLGRGHHDLGCTMLFEARRLVAKATGEFQAAYHA